MALNYITKSRLNKMSYVITGIEERVLDVPYLITSPWVRAVDHTFK